MPDATTTTADAGITQTPIPFDWAGAIPDETVRGWTLAKGYKDVAGLAQSAWNQEKLLGVPADQIVKLPKDDNAEAWSTVYDRLGRPKDPKEYGLPVPEGDKGEFAATAAKWFHEAGLSARQARVVAERWNAHVVATTKTQTDTATAAEQAEGVKLKADWGAKFDENVKLVDAAAVTFGMTAEQLLALKTVMGPSAAMKFVHAIGSKLGVEGTFVSADRMAGGQFTTPELAKARIEALKGDKGFIARFTSGDVDARAEMRKLHREAYPGDTVL